MLLLQRCYQAFSWCFEFSMQRGEKLKARKQKCVSFTFRYHSKITDCQFFRLGTNPVNLSNVRWDHVLKGSLMPLLLCVLESIQNQKYGWNHGNTKSAAFSWNRVSPQTGPHAFCSQKEVSCFSLSHLTSRITGTSCIHKELTRLVCKNNSVSRHLICLFCQRVFGSSR